ncbi:MAG: YbbR-like domain-containing protein [Vicinamibacterales bacterium]
MALFPIRHVGLKLLSIAVAVLLWLVVAGDPIVERTLRVGLELQRTPEELELVGSVPDTVSVRLRGPASRLSGLGPGNLSVVVDLEGARPGRRLFTLTSNLATAPYGIEVLQITPATLTLSFEGRAVRVLPVRPQIEGTPVPGHSVTNVSVTPSQVRIEGPESAVGVLTEVPTEPVSVERATTLVREAVALDLPESGVRLVGGAGTAVVTVTVSADTTERTITAVPIAVRGGPAGAVAAPATAAVTVQGASDVVASLTPADILLFVDVLDAGVARDLTVHAESSPRYVVRAIAPPVVRVGGRARP